MSNSTVNTTGKNRPKKIIFIIVYILNIISPVIRWCSSGMSRSQQQIKTFPPNTFQMQYAVLISVNFRSSWTHGWPWSNWSSLSNPLSIVPNAPIITDTIFVLTFHILLTTISRSFYFFIFSVYSMLMFESSGKAISISTQVFSLSSCTILSAHQVGLLVLSTLC
jgi:hypothetical protein